MIKFKHSLVITSCVFVQQMLVSLILTSVFTKHVLSQHVFDLLAGLSQHVFGSLAGLPQLVSDLLAVASTRVWFTCRVASTRVWTAPSPASVAATASTCFTNTTSWTWVLCLRVSMLQVSLAHFVLAVVPHIQAYRHVHVHALLVHALNVVGCRMHLLVCIIIYFSVQCMCIML